LNLQHKIFKIVYVAELPYLKDIIR